MAIKIGLDAGHGLYTAGKQTPDGIKEWTLNDKVRDKVVKILADYDCEIIHTDNDEGAVNEELADRVNRYSKEGVAAFVSIHHNAYKGDWCYATGVEIFTDNNPIAKDTELANCIYNRLVKYTGLKGRGIKKKNFAVINQNRIPAVLVEGGFMDCKNDYKVITSDEGQTAYAKAVAEGLIEFLNLQKKKVIKPAATTGAVKEGDLVSIKSGAKYYDGTAVPSWVVAQKWYVDSVKGDRAVIDKSENGKNSIDSPINVLYLTVVKSTTVSTPKTYKKGDVVKLSNTPLYANSTTTKVSSNKTGTYYIYDGEKINGRYRITNKQDRCGKKPTWMYVTGWVKL